MMRHCGTARLETERLILRKFVPEDAEYMFRNWASDPTVTEFMTWPPHPSVEESRRIVGMWIDSYARPENYQWAIELKEIREPIGSINVVRMNENVDECELGWCLGRQWWGRSIMPEAASAVVKYLFEAVGANRVAARHAVENAKSGRVMQKIGMAMEGVLRQSDVSNHGLEDMAQYSILASEYQQKRP